ncbi:DUF885 domain-containing protein [Pararhodonellum marinum]|uniref:DUF885 domain-containing protein n=1 Tax=Pararhodonellum marinum TaxID=2755358 RepID=UPI001E5AFBD1|nr:DUF885 domain-containing protein [Pararhodonellum marinum]
MKKQLFHWLFLFGLAFLCFSCGTDQPAEDQSDDINAWFDEQHEAYLQKSPLRLTSLGRKDLYDQIDDLSEEAEAERLAWWENSVAEMKSRFDYDLLDPQTQLSYDLWIYQKDMAEAEAAFRRHNYVFHQMGGMHTNLPNMLINFHKVDDTSDLNALINRIKETGRANLQMLERAKLQTEQGIRPPKFAYETVITQTKALISGKPFTEEDKGAPLWNDAIGKMEALQEAGKISEEEAETFRGQIETALVEHFQPAYEELIAWLESELPELEDTPTGVSRHPNGMEYYQHQLRSSTTNDLTAEEIHQIGLDEVDRILGEMMAIKEQVGFEGDLKAFFDFVNTDSQFFYPNTDEGRQGYLDDSKAFLDTLTEKLPDYFGLLPKAQLQVRRVEAFREQDGAPQHYMQGTPDGSRPGTYYVHLSDMKSMPKSTMEGVAYHEGNPGHHMQISIAQELESLPQFRTQLFFNSYVEGWALYSEILAKEMGGYQNPYYDFGRLVNEIWRAIRLVVDTGLHAKDWKEVDAIQYFSENSSISAGAIKAEVRRYMVMPGQATGYKIGMLKIQELRQYAERELGDDFDIKAFHDVMLGGGALPLNLLEKEVNRWVMDVKQN